MKRIITIIIAAFVVAGCQPWTPTPNPRPVAPHAGEDMSVPNGYHDTLPSEYVPRGSFRR